MSMYVVGECILEWVSAQVSVQVKFEEGSTDDI